MGVALGSLGGLSGVGRVAGGRWAGGMVLAGVTRAGGCVAGLLRRLVTCGGWSWADLGGGSGAGLVEFEGGGGVAGWLALGFGWDSSGGRLGCCSTRAGSGLLLPALWGCVAGMRFRCGDDPRGRNAFPLGRSCSGSSVKRRAPHGAGLGVVHVWAVLVSSPSSNLR